MLVITLQIVLLLAAIVLPLKTRKNKIDSRYKIDTDTSNALYAVNEYGTLEKINRIKLNDRSLL
ncbi:MAG: hypothetical protein V4560_02825 [Bacteroidota bacterium]|jgi:hypothetical protein